MSIKVFLFSLSLVACVVADLKCASRPKEGYRIINEGGIPFVTKNIWHKYMIPETFGYKGLLELRQWGLFQDGAGGRTKSQWPPPLPPRGQKYTNYDNFLRSNIDNEQDNRVFENAPGHDHLPFRTSHTRVKPFFQTDQVDAIGEQWGREGSRVGPIDLRMTIKPNQSVLVPIRWNNPHASEVEVNLWIFPSKSQPVVVPFRKPTCSGEGHQDSIIRFTVPEDFTKLGAKIPGFSGCNVDTKPMCTVQVYGHSVESRQYAFAWPVIIPGHDKSLTTSDSSKIEPIATDPILDLGQLRDLCLPATDPSGDLAVSVPRWARLVSDVYTHAYMNSDYSPYSGQQHESISKNMQASCVNKMWAANHGELGKSILPSATQERLERLETLEDRIYKRYERAADRLISRIEDIGAMKTSGKICAGGTCQRLASGFRCAEVGAVNSERLDTNTYIPSFQIPKQWVRKARQEMFSQYSELIQPNGQVQIYLQTLKDLLPYLQPSQPYGILYQTAMLKDTLTTKADATKFMKRNKKGNIDNGFYAATQAKHAFAESLGCPADCLHCNPARCNNSWDNCYQPLLRNAAATCIKGKCSKCKALFFRPGELAGKKAAPPTVPKLAANIAKGNPLPEEDVDQYEYPDVDGSPRIGRPPQPDEDPVPQVEEEDWDSYLHPDDAVHPKNKHGEMHPDDPDDPAWQDALRDAQGSLLAMDAEIEKKLITLASVEEEDEQAEGCSSTALLQSKKTQQSNTQRSGVQFRRRRDRVSQRRRRDRASVSFAGVHSSPGQFRRRRHRVPQRRRRRDELDTSGN